MNEEKKQLQKFIKYNMKFFLPSKNGVSISDWILDLVFYKCKAAQISALETIKKKVNCTCKIEFGTSADCDNCADEHAAMYEVCAKLADLKSKGAN
jgi:hypothetical protein